MRFLFFVCLLSSISKIIIAQEFSFETILTSRPILKKVSSNAKKYRLQIIYTQINRDASGKPSFKDYTYRLDSDYFYCASLVKLPVSILALEKTKDLRVQSSAIMFTDSANACQHKVTKDTTSKNGYPSVAQYIKRMALVSDNFAYGRVYEFLGVDYIHNRLNELGFSKTRIVHRFDGGCSGKEHVITNPVTFYKKDLSPLLSLDQQIATKTYENPLGIVKVGKAYINAKNKKINEPKDFTQMNYLPLSEVHLMLQKLIFNNYLPLAQRYNVIEEDRESLINQLTLYPRESSYPTYNTKTYYDSYKKYFIYGDTKKMITNSDIKITNIVGQSYGFMADCAYIKNETKGIEFMLSAVIYTNEDEIINDGKYEYNTIALPFLAELSRQIYNYELKR